MKKNFTAPAIHSILTNFMAMSTCTSCRFTTTENWTRAALQTHGGDGARPTNQGGEGPCPCWICKWRGPPWPVREVRGEGRTEIRYGNRRCRHCELGSTAMGRRRGGHAAAGWGKEGRRGHGREENGPCAWSLLPRSFAGGGMPLTEVPLWRGGRAH
jgi:hypothetical protein